MRLSAIVPCYNESRHIAQNLASLLDQLKPLNIAFEIVAVSDGSTDDTAKILETFAPPVTFIKYGVHRGKGHALKVGFKRSHGEIIVFHDADIVLRKGEMARYLDLLDQQEADVIIGSKRAMGMYVPRPVWRRIGSYGINWLVRHVVGLPFTDTQAGFKMFRRDILEQITPLSQASGYAFDIELLLLNELVSHGKVLEQPLVLEKYDHASLRWKELIKMVREIFFLAKIHSPSDNS